MDNSNNILRHIEKLYDVNLIQYNNIKLWAVLRIYLYDKLNVKKRRNEANKSTIFVILKSMFRYNPMKLFRKYDLWIFTAADSRKIVGEKAIHGVTGGMVDLFPNSLIWENPFPRFHFPKRLTKGDKIIGASWLYVGVYIVELIYKILKPDIQNEKLLKKISCDYQLDWNYKGIIYRFLAQYHVMNFILLWSTPKNVIITCPYTLMGVVLAFKKKKIPVIEMQHGVINSSHFAYNSLITNSQYSPDYLLVFGDVERKCFFSQNLNYVDQKNIYITGTYILQMIKELPVSNFFTAIKSENEKVVVVAAQEVYEELLIDFIMKAAEIDTSIFYVYVPRIMKDYREKLTARNIRIFSGNIYLFINEGDVHATVSSTTCMEANFLGKQTVFININNLAYDYYGDILTLGDGAYYANTPEEFVKYLKDMDVHKVIESKKDFYGSNHMELIKKFVHSNLVF